MEPDAVVTLLVEAHNYGLENLTVGYSRTSGHSVVSHVALLYFSMTP